MYEVADEIDQKKEALKEDLVNDAERLETHEEVSRVRHEEQLLLHQVTDLNTRESQH
jgi:hypothetical protein